MIYKSKENISHEILQELTSNRFNAPTTKRRTVKQILTKQINSPAYHCQHDN